MGRAVQSFGPKAARRFAKITGAFRKGQLHGKDGLVRDRDEALMLAYREARKVHFATRRKKR